MRRKRISILAKILLFLSFSFILVGICFLLGEKNTFYDPVKDVYVIYYPEENNTKVTLANEDRNFNDMHEKKIIHNDVNDFHDNLSQEQINLQLKEEMESISGITIYYGNDIGNYLIGGMSTTPLIDSKEIYQSLLQLNSAINLYPKDFFKEYEEKGIHLIIYLVKNYSIDNVTGVTDTSSNNVSISLAADYPIIESFHHEAYHYIDYCIEKSGGLYTVWDNLNPHEFSYNGGLSYDKSLSYSSTVSKDSYFVNNYAQTSASEDRASTFEYMMINNKPNCLDFGTPIWMKARYISQQIDLFFDTVSPSVLEYWERYI